MDIPFLSRSAIRLIGTTIRRRSRVRFLFFCIGIWIFKHREQIGKWLHVSRLRGLQRFFHAMIPRDDGRVMPFHSFQDLLRLLRLTLQSLRPPFFPGDEPGDVE